MSYSDNLKKLKELNDLKVKYLNEVYNKEQELSDQYQLKELKERLIEEEIIYNKWYRNDYSYDVDKVYHELSEKYENCCLEIEEKVKASKEYLELSALRSQIKNLRHLLKNH